MPTVLESLKMQSKKDIQRGIHLLLAGDANPRMVLIQLQLETKLALQCALAIVEALPEEMVKTFLDALDDPEAVKPTPEQIADALAWAKRVNAEGD